VFCVGSVSERVLELEERPWMLLLEHARDSVRQMEQIRFHMELAEDPHGSTVALYVGNITPNLNQRQYENVLLEYLGRENKYSSIGPIYYEYGSLVITYEVSTLLDIINDKFYMLFCFYTGL
jgi:diacylglycerol kinase (ATP)